MKKRMICLCTLLAVSFSLGAEQAKTSEEGPTDSGKRVVIIAGDVDAPYGLNEFHAGSLLLAKSLHEIRPEMKVEVFNNQWPEDLEVLQRADVIVLYTVDDDELVNAHLQELSGAVKKGTGVVSILYDLFRIKGIKKKDAQRWGHMDYEQKQYNLFTPVLTHLNDDNTFTVNQLLLGVPAVSKDSRHHLILGGHWHWAWGQTFYRRLTLQCIVQSAGQGQKWTGFKLRNLTFEELQENLDVEPPADFDLEPIRWHVDQWNATADEVPPPSPWWNNDLRPYDMAEEDDRGVKEAEDEKKGYGYKK